MPALGLFPGIRYDPREPPPPGYGVNFRVAPQRIDNNFWDHPHQQPRENYINPVNLHKPWPDQDDTDEPELEHDRFNPLPRWQAPRPVPAVRPHEPQEPQEAFLAPLSTSVTVQIVHDTAKFTVVHLFSNQTTRIKQGVYQFPLPHEATVTDFNCRIGLNRIVRGNVKEKEEARRAFNDAIRQGRAGGIVEQQTAEIFTTTLANIPPDTKMRAELTFMCLLKYRKARDQEVFTLTIPTYVAPRYGDIPQGIRLDRQRNTFLSLDVDILTAEELISVTSDTHDIDFNRGPGQRPCQTWNDFVVRRAEEAANLKSGTVQLKEGRAGLDKDLVIKITTAMSNTAGEPQACLETHPTFDHHQAVMLTIPSDFMLAAENPSQDGEIIFVADRSGSMIDKIDSLKSAMMFFINGIPENRPFNIWCFGSHSTSMWPRSKPFNEGTKQEAINYVRWEFKSDMGGTDILPALQNIYHARGGHHSMDIIVLTDGELWSPNETIEFVKNKWMISEGMIRFFSLGIGHAVSHQLVEGIAKAGGGYAEVISAASGGGWEDRVVAVLKAATTGHIGPIHIDLEWKKGEGLEKVAAAKYKMSPNDISTISPFLRNRVFWLFDSGSPGAELGSIVLTSKGSSGTDVVKRIIPKSLAMADSTIHKLAVRALLGELERGESWIHGTTLNNDFYNMYNKQHLVREAAIQLGCKWSLVSQWTSIYAVEEETEEPNEGMDIDIQLPAANQAIEDALLQPRGAANVNADRLIGAPEKANDDESGSDSDDSMDIPSIGRAKSDDDSDDDVENNYKGDNPGNNPDGSANGGSDNNRDNLDRSHDSSDQGGNSPTPEGTPPDGNNIGHQLGGGPLPSTFTIPFQQAAGTSSGTQVQDSGLNPGSGHHSRSASPQLPSTPSFSNQHLSSDTAVEFHAYVPPSGNSSPGEKKRKLQDSYSNTRLTAKMRLPTRQGGSSLRPPSASKIPVPHSLNKTQASDSSKVLLGNFAPPYMFDFPATGSSNAPPVQQQQPSSYLSGLDFLSSGGEKGSVDYSRLYQSASQAQSAMPQFGIPVQPSYSPIQPTSLSHTSSYWARSRAATAGSSAQVSSAGPHLTQGSAASYPLRQPMQRAASQYVSPMSGPTAYGNAYSPSTSPIPVPDTTTMDSAEGIYKSGPGVIEHDSFLSGVDFTAHESESFDFFGVESSAPVYNPPASTSLLSGNDSREKTKEELAAEDFVRSLLAYQRSDGCFVFDSVESVKLVLGPSFLRVVQKIKVRHYSLNMVVTFAIIELLELQFQQCESLWVLMARKAKEYINNETSLSERELLKKGFRKVAPVLLGSVVDEVRDTKNAEAAVIDLQIAPVY